MGPRLDKLVQHREEVATLVGQVLISWIVLRCRLDSRCTSSEPVQLEGGCTTHSDFPLLRASDFVSNRRPTDLCVQRLEPLDDSVVIWLKPDIYQVENSVCVLYLVHGSGARLIQLAS